MATDKKIGRRELISKVLAGGLAAGTYALSGQTFLLAGDKQREIQIEDVSTVGEKAEPRTCAPYSTKRMYCSKYVAYLNASKLCQQRYSARCGATFTCH